MRPVPVWPHEAMIARMLASPAETRPDAVADGAEERSTPGPSGPRAVSRVDSIREGIAARRRRWRPIVKPPMQDLVGALSMLTSVPASLRPGEAVGSFLDGGRSLHAESDRWHDPTSGDWALRDVSMPAARIPLGRVANHPAGVARDVSQAVQNDRDWRR